MRRRSLTIGIFVVIVGAILFVVYLPLPRIWGPLVTESLESAELLFPENSEIEFLTIELYTSPKISFRTTSKSSRELLGVLRNAHRISLRWEVDVKWPIMGEIIISSRNSASVRVVQFTDSEKNCWLEINGPGYKTSIDAEEVERLIRKLYSVSGEGKE